MLKQNSNTDLLTLKPAFLSFFKPGPQACCPHCEMRLIKSTDEVSLCVLGEVILVTLSTPYLAHRKCSVPTSYWDGLPNLTASLEYVPSPPKCLPRKVQVNVRRWNTLWSRWSSLWAAFDPQTQTWGTGQSWLDQRETLAHVKPWGSPLCKIKVGIRKDMTHFSYFWSYCMLPWELWDGHSSPHELKRQQ